MDDDLQKARARIARAAMVSRKARTPDAAAELTSARRDYAAARLRTYIREMVDEWPPLTAEQLDTIRDLLVPLGVPPAPTPAAPSPKSFSHPGDANDAPQGF